MDLFTGSDIDFSIRVLRAKCMLIISAHDCAASFHEYGAPPDANQFRKCVLVVRLRESLQPRAKRYWLSGYAGQIDLANFIPMLLG